MFDFPKDTFPICLQLNGSRKEYKDINGKTIDNCREEELFDRIISRSDKNIYTSCYGIVPANRLYIFDIKFHNPYVLLYVKLLSEEETKLYNEYVNDKWFETIKEWNNSLTKSE